MAIKEITQIRRFIGLSTDDVPTDAPPGSRYFATDKGIWYIFDGTTWWTEQALIDILMRGYAVAAHDATDPVQVLAGNGEGEGSRAVLIIVKCTETLAGSAKLPIFEVSDGDTAIYGMVGEGGSPEQFSDGEIAIFAGVLAEEKPVIATVTNGDGEDVAGAIQVFVIAVEVANNGNGGD